MPNTIKIGHANQGIANNTSPIPLKMNATSTEPNITTARNANDFKQPGSLFAIIYSILESDESYLDKF